MGIVCQKHQSKHNATTKMNASLRSRVRAEWAFSPAPTLLLVRVHLPPAAPRCRPWHPTATPCLLLKHLSWRGRLHRHGLLLLLHHHHHLLLLLLGGRASYRRAHAHAHTVSMGVGRDRAAVRAHLALDNPLRGQVRRGKIPTLPELPSANTDSRPQGGGAVIWPRTGAHHAAHRGPARHLHRHRHGHRHGHAAHPHAILAVGLWWGRRGRRAYHPEHYLRLEEGAGELRVLA